MPEVDSFEKIVRKVFTAIYPVIAQQILKQTGISKVRCLDVGCGTGHLGLAVAERSELEVTFFDQSPFMLSVTRENITARGLENRSRTLLGEMSYIPMPDCSANLAVNRGGVFFWNRPALAFAEIYRVLVPGGKAVLGAGFGTAALKKQIAHKECVREGHRGQWESTISRNGSRELVGKYECPLHEARIPDYEINLGVDTGFWITIRK